LYSTIKMKTLFPLIKKYCNIAVLVLFFLSASSLVFAQNVAINTSGAPASASAILDLTNSASMALLAPQVTLTSTSLLAPIPAPGPAGLLVYNSSTSTANGLTGAGYYYWTGSAWVALGGGGGSLSGGTTNYLARWTSSTALGIGVAQDNGTAVGISSGVITPKNLLDVNGAVAVGSYAGTNTAPSNGMIVSGQLGVGNSAPASSAVVDFTNTQAAGSTGAALVWPTNPSPSVNITPPVLGEEVYNTTTGCFNFYNGTAWVANGCPCNTAPGTATISTSGCASPYAGESVTYTSSITTGVTYNWTATATTGTPTISANGLSNITVTWPAGAANTGTVSLALSNMCGTTSATALSVPITAEAISGATTILESNNYTYSVTTAASSYSWSITTNPGGASISSATNIQTITVAAGSSAGTLVLQCVVTGAGGCSVTETYTVTVIPCGTIFLDNAVTAAQNTKIFNITTTLPNEIVLVFVDGLVAAHRAFTGTLAVSNGGAIANTQLINTENYTASYGYTENQAVYAFVAATATTYSITVTEAAASGMSWFDNSALALEGFCNTATVAGNIITGTVPVAAEYTSAGSSTNTLTNNSVTPTVANSYIASNFCTWEYGGTGTITWTAPAGSVTLGAITNSVGLMDFGYAGYSAAAAANVTVTLTDTYPTALPNIALGTLQCIDVHN